MARTQVDIDILTHLGAAISELGKMQQAMAGVGQEAQKSGSKLDQMKEGMESLGPAARKTFAVATAAIGGATAAFASYEVAMKNVQNISGQTDAQMAEITQRFLDLPPTLGEADDLMKALYQTISSGVTNTEDAFGVVVNSAKAAKGNLADMTQTVDGLTSVLNAYGLEAEEATAVLDSMTKTVDLGKLTFGDLSANIGKGISIASAAGVSYNELLSVLATLTLNGLSVEEAMTAIRNIMIVAVKPTKEVKDNMEALGVDMSATALKTQGFAEWMGTAAEAVAGNAEMTAMLFPNIRALNGAMKLASTDGLAKYNDTLSQIENSTGKVESNYQNMAESTANATADLVTEFKKMGIEFGAITNEYMEPLIRGLTGLIGKIRDLDEPTKLFITQFTALSGAIAGVILIGPKIITAFTAIRGAFFLTGEAALAAGTKIKAMNVAMGLAVAAGLALQYGINKLAEHIEKSSDWIDQNSRAIAQRSKAMQQAAKLEGVSLRQLAEDLGAVATEDQDLSNVILGRLQILQKQGKLTEEQERVLQAYSKQIKANTGALDDNNDKHEQSAEVLQMISEIKAGLAGVEADLAEKEEERLKRQEKAAKAHRDSAEGMREYAEQVGDVTYLLSLLPQPFTEAEKGADDFGNTVKQTSEDLEIATVDLQEFHDEVAKEIKPPPPWSQDWQDALDKISVNLKDSLAIAIGDSLFEGFDSVGDWIGGIFESWGETFMEVWRNQVFNGETFSALLSGDMSLGNLAQSIAQQGAENPWIYGLGGIAGIYSGAQTGGVGGFMQGAIGGVGAWAGLAPLITGAAATGWGLAIAAIIGGAISLFGSGGDEAPWFSAIMGDPLGLTGATGFRVSESGGGMAFDERSREVFDQQMNFLIEQTRAGWRDALLMFEDLSLFDLVGEIPSEMFGHMEMSSSEFAQYFGEVWLPEQMTAMFREAIDTGLGRFGVTGDTLNRLWDELGVLPGPDRIQALTDYITAVIDGAELLEDMDWNAIMDSVGLSPRDAFVQFMNEGLTNIDMAMFGFGELSLIEQARQAQTIQEMITAARQAEIQYLQQIEQISNAIADSIGSQIEQLRLGGMGDLERADYAASQIADIFGQLMAGDLSPDVVQMLVGDAQRYISLLEDIMGEEGLAAALPDILADYFGGQGWMENLEALFPEGMPANWTGRDFLIALLEQLGTISEDALEEARAEAQELNQQYIDRLTEINAQLTGFDGALEDLASDDGVLTQTNERFDHLNESSATLADEFERVTAALNGWDPNTLEQALQNHTIINIDPNLAPLIALIQEVVYGAIGSGNAPPPDGVF